ncbi:hypothetical protein O9G_000985 [Rozella allomycis CSF55]|uniref:Tetratricopeptide repeat protein 30 n=1 Tax=Rozella allomycis (strain CSF55) TaxID=988480 RepID=A0A075ANC4_ROZAC|nr:hypothetical protein O9G_000985 [Rozella allomycis CSF55]|eukprot:EPZ31340.1 hypothetical protein O9G_000985 [Rozella allomycis CSF55]
MTNLDNYKVTDLRQIPVHKITSTIYTLISDNKYNDVIDLLAPESTTYSNSRALYSLLAFCYYQTEDFNSAAGCYETLINYYPDYEEYKLYFAQCLYKIGDYEGTRRIVSSIVQEDLLTDSLKLLAAAHFEADDISSCKKTMEKLPTGDIDSLINNACIAQKLNKGGDYENAIRQYLDIIKIYDNEHHTDLLYNLALCYYEIRQYDLALKYITVIIEITVKNHPEYLIGVHIDTNNQEDLRYIENSESLHESRIIEACNLKASIEFKLKKFKAAKDSLNDFPPRLDMDIDPITLHNQAIINCDENPESSFDKLHFLLYQDPSPLTTFANLLLLYIKYQYENLAADVLSENSHLESLIPQHIREYIDARILQVVSPQDAAKKLDTLVSQSSEILRKILQKLQNMSQDAPAEEQAKVLYSYDDQLARFVPYLMAFAYISWQNGKYQTVEKIFKTSVEYCNGMDSWKANVGHTLYMQEKYADAIGFYEPIFMAHKDNILEITPIILANLCVSYIMTSLNERAEEIMKIIEKEEEKITSQSPDKRIYHLCIVNLVIGTLYCTKGNFEFGITRIIKAMEPYNRKLGTETWMYAKRCIMSLLLTLSKQMMIIKESTWHEIIDFLEAAELYGKNIVTVVDPLMQNETWDEEKEETRFISQESRIIKKMYLEIMALVVANKSIGCMCLFIDINVGFISIITQSKGNLMECT